MQSEKLGVVVIGAGWAGRVHLKCWSEVPNTELVGVCDTNLAAAQKAATDFGAKNVYATLKEALAAPNTHVVSVCTPNMFHRECVVAALGAGKHCACEKPLAVTPAEIEAMIAARDRAGKLLMTTQHMRFENQTQSLKRIIDTGRLGAVYYARAVWLRRRGAPAALGFINKQQAGHGPGMDIGVHVLDLACHLMGRPQAVSVSGIADCKLAQRPDNANQWGSFKVEDFQVEDFAAAFVRFADGGALTLEVSWLLNQRESETFGIWLYGTEGGAKWPDLTLNYVQEGLLIDTQIASGHGHDGHKNALSAFAEAIRQGKPSPVPPEESLNIARILAAIYESAASGREVRL